MAKQTRKERAAQSSKNNELPSVSTPTTVSSTRVAPRQNQPVVQKIAKTGEMPFNKDNYLWLGICFLLIVVAYTLMRIENAEDGFLALYVCPVLLGAGYLGVFYALFKRNKSLSE